MPDSLTRQLSRIADEHRAIAAHLINELGETINPEQRHTLRVAINRQLEQAEMWDRMLKAKTA